MTCFGFVCCNKSVKSLSKYEELTPSELWSEKYSKMESLQEVLLKNSLVDVQEIVREALNDLQEINTVISTKIKDTESRCRRWKWIAKVDWSGLLVVAGLAAALAAFMSLASGREGNVWLIVRILLVVGIIFAVFATLNIQSYYDDIQNKKNELRLFVDTELSDIKTLKEIFSFLENNHQVLVSSFNESFSGLERTEPENNQISMQRASFQRKNLYSLCQELPDKQRVFFHSYLKSHQGLDERLEQAFQDEKAIKKQINDFLSRYITSEEMSKKKYGFIRSTLNSLICWRKSQNQEKQLIKDQKASDSLFSETLIKGDLDDAHQSVVIMTKIDDQIQERVDTMKPVEKKWKSRSSRMQKGAVLTAVIAPACAALMDVKSEPESEILFTLRIGLLVSVVATTILSYIFQLKSAKYERRVVRLQNSTQLEHRHTKLLKQVFDRVKHYQENLSDVFSSESERIKSSIKASIPVLPFAYRTAVENLLERAQAIMREADGILLAAGATSSSSSSYSSRISGRHLSAALLESVVFSVDSEGVELEIED